jgi:hypothetical protein
LLPPSAYSSEWRCGEHGGVLPLNAFHRLEAPDFEHVAAAAEVPVWLPDPLPVGWALAGLAAVGDLRSGFRATATAFIGPAPLGGEGEWLLVAEEPAIGLGAAYALSAPVELTAAELDQGGPPAKVHALGRPTPLWPAPSRRPDRSAYVGEAEGVWLWMIGFPADAGYAVLENLVLTDARDGLPADLPRSAPSLRMRPT